MISIPRSRAAKLAVVATGILFLFVVQQTFLSGIAFQSPGFFLHSDTLDRDFADFGNALFRTLEDHPPNVGAINRTGEAPALVFWRATEDTQRPDVLNLSSDDVAAMRAAHEAYLDDVQHLSVPFGKGSSGIVSTAGGAYLPVFVISLRMLRRTGCDLPVELFLHSKDEYDRHLCDTVLPSLDARCIELETRVSIRASELANFQLKVFSILASSFENVLFLDADNFMVQDPRHIFTEEPYLSSGLVTWTDFWASSASRHFYDIIGYPIPLMNVHASTESGQLLISKSSHGKALLMAAYYNFYGPKHFYPLMSQGGPGEGDKESFIAGAQAISTPFYQVKKCVDTIGYYEDGGYHGGAMLQYDPNYDLSDEALKTPRAFSVHHNIPKYDPVQLFALGVTVHAVTGEPHRILGTKELTLQRFGRDVESELWEEIQYVACELGDKFEKWDTVPTTPEQRGTCDTVRWYRSKVFGDDVP